MATRSDWRLALRKAESGMRVQLKAERDKGTGATYDVCGEMFCVNGATDNRLDVIAHAYAVKTVEAAIRQSESREIADRVKSRRGEAL